jgi:hypothetical protein
MILDLPTLGYPTTPTVRDFADAFEDLIAFMSREDVRDVMLERCSCVEARKGMVGATWRK